VIVFIAIELEHRSREKISEYVRTSLRPMCRGGRWVDMQNYHLTLKYIGEAACGETNELYGLLNQAAAQFESFMLTTGSVGVFGKSQSGRARVLWLDTVGDIRALREIREYIEGKAVGLGFRADNRFSPHITLARDVMLTRQPEKIHPVNINVTSVSLMESRSEKGKRVYLPLSVHKFG
jgi:2'-5' RNA ligase